MQHLVKLKGYYYLRLRVPVDMQGVLRIREIKKALHTKQLRHAKLIMKKFDYQIEQTFTLMRCGMISNEEMRSIISRFLHDTLQNFEDGRVREDNVSDEVTLEKLIKAYEIMENEDTESLKLNRLEGVQGWFDSALSEQGVEVDKDSFEYRKLCREALKTRIEFWKIETERLKGNYNNEYDKIKMLQLMQPQSVNGQQQPVKQESGRLLSEVMSAYVKHKAENWSYKTKMENEHIFKLALDIIGDKDVGLLAHEDFLRYRDVLKKLPANYQKKKEYKDKTIPEIMDMMEKKQVAAIAIKTRNKNLQGMSTLMKWCSEDKKYILVNHAKGLATKDKTKGKDKRRPYDTEDIRALLASPVYTTEIPVEKPERFWIPLIALFSGARLNEICSLHVEDVRSVDGVMCFDINQNTDDKTIKNEASERCIPVHPTLRDAGFLEYLERLKQKGEARVFPNLSLTKANSYGGAFGKWYGRYSRTYVSQDPKKVFHSFRKSVANTLKQNSVDSKKIEEILGHTDNSMSTGYYADPYQAKVLYEALLKLDYGVSFKGVRFGGEE